MYAYLKSGHLTKHLKGLKGWPSKARHVIGPGSIPVEERDAVSMDFPYLRQELQI